MSKPVVVHIIVGLYTGGAEKTLLKVCSGLPEFHHHVVSLTGFGGLAPAFLKTGAELHYLDMRTTSGVIRGLAFLMHFVWKTKPSLIQSWMYHSDLVTVVIKLIAPRTPIVWNLRHSALTPSSSRRTRLIQRVLVRMSWFVPRAIVAAGVTVRDEHERIGYSMQKLSTIPNGIDLEVFRADSSLRNVKRTRLGLAQDQLLIGFVGKWDPHKGVESFLDALKLLSDWGWEVQFLMVGKDLLFENSQLVDLLDRRQLTDHAHLIGPVPDVQTYLNALDVMVSASETEGFPNVIAEAVACGVPVVATDVGDSRRLLASENFLVPPRSPVKLAGAIDSLLALPPAERKKIADTNYRWASENYSMEQMLVSYDRLWRKCMT